MTKNESMPNQIIETYDEEGKIHKFKLLEIIDVEEKEYGIFEYLDNKADSDDDDSEEDLMVMRMTEIKGETYFEIIDDEEEFELVSEYIETFRDELNLE